MCAEARRAAKRRDQSAHSSQDESTLILDETNMEVEETNRPADKMDHDPPARANVQVGQEANDDNSVSEN